MAGAAAAAYMRGPLHFLLQSSGGQWILLGVGAFSLFPDKMGEILRLTFDRLLIASSSGGGNSNNNDYPRLMNHPSSSNHAPIIIHTGGNNNDKGSTRTMVMYIVSAAGIWMSYTALSNLLPDTIKELLPVTRKVFDKSITNVAKAIINVKEVLGKQIVDLSDKQDQLNDKQDVTLQEISNLQENVDHIRNDLDEIGDAMSRCETSLDHAERLQSYTARGVKLLVKTVATMIPGDHRAVNELSKYTKEGEYLDNNNHTKEGQQQQQQNDLTTPRPTSSSRSLSLSSMNHNPQEKTPTITDPEKEHPMTGGGSAVKLNNLESPALQELLSLILEGEGHFKPLVPKVMGVS